MTKMFNWTFGSFFRSLVRYLFYVFLGLMFYFISTRLNFNLFDLFGIDCVHAEVIYSLESTPNNLYSAVNYNIIDKSKDIEGKLSFDYYSGYVFETYPLPYQNSGSSYIVEDDFNNSILRGIGKRLFDYSQAFTNTTDTTELYVYFDQITLGVANNPLTYQPLIFPCGYDYKFSFLIATGEKNNIFASDNFGWTTPAFQNIFYRGDYYSNFWSWGRVDGMKQNFTRQSNSGNLTWLSWYLYDDGVSNMTNYSNTLFIPNTYKIYSNSSDVTSQGVSNWIYILDWKVERVVAGSNDNFDTLGFAYSNVNSNGYWTDESLGLLIDGIDNVGGNTGGSFDVPDINIDTDLFNSDFVLFYDFVDISSMNIFVDYDFSTFTDFEKLILTICFNIMYLIFVIIVVYILLKALNKMLSWVFR